MKCRVEVMMLGAALLACYTGAAAGSRSIADMSERLGRMLTKAFDVSDLTPIDSNETTPTYKMHVTFESRGMAGLYNITTVFMDLVQPPGVIPDDMELDFVDNQGHLDIEKLQDDLPSLLKQYVGLLTLIIIGVLFLVLMPCVGFLFCCCRCCGNCGARSQPFDKKHDTCKKVILAMLLIAVATLLLFGVVCAFVSNQDIQQSTEELPSDLLQGISDLKTYLTHTDSQIHTLLVKNFNEVNTALMEMLDNSAQNIVDELNNISKAISFTALVDFVEKLNSTAEDLQYMKRTTNELRVNASQLSDGLRRVKNELIHSLNNCSVCADIRTEVNKMNTTVDFDRLPDVSDTIGNLTDIITNTNFVEKIKMGNESLQNITKDIQHAIDGSKPQVNDAISQAGSKLTEGYTTTNTTLRDLVKALADSESSIKDADNYIKEFSPYRYYIGIAESSILLIIILCITCGLMCGVCGKRPDGYDDDCCNKGAGSRFLMIAVGVMFLFSFFLMLITLSYFLSGVLVQRWVCDTLRNPEGNRLFTVFDKMVNIEATIPTNLSSLIRECHNNESAYNVFQLESKLNITQIQHYLEEYNIAGKMQEIKDKVKIGDNIELFDNETENGLKKLNNSGIGHIDFDKFKDILEHNLTSIDLSALAKNLRNLTEYGPAKKDENMRMSLNQNAMYLDMYQANLVDPMIEAAEELKRKTTRMEDSLRLNQESKDFQQAIQKVTEEIKNTQEYLRENGTKAIEKIVANFTENFMLSLMEYVYHVGNRTMSDVGKCGPLSNVYNQTLVATCDKIFIPWNGFWVCVGWCLILFIPGIILSVKLATLYQKSESYPGPLVEAEYLYDAYADRDNIPLSNVPHKKGKKMKGKKRGGGDMYESHGSYAPDGRTADPRSAPPRERDAPGGSSHPDTRYADMAPKHWDDYPNGGPPQYQSAPMATEYERPPPYYYPGPGDRP